MNATHAGEALYPCAQMLIHTVAEEPASKGATMTEGPQLIPGLESR